MKNLFVIPKTHPSLPGHFPNNPIVPGAVVLDMIVEAIKSNWSGKIVSKIIFAKFVRPLNAEQEVTLSIEEKTKKVIKFTCTSCGEVIVSGQCEISGKGVT